MAEQQHIVPEERAGVTKFVFTDWAAEDSAQRASIETLEKIKQDEILMEQMFLKEREIRTARLNLWHDIQRYFRDYEERAKVIERKLAAMGEPAPMTTA